MLTTKGGAKMAQTKENKEKTHLTLSPEIKRKGFADADNLGMSFSAYVSMLIANYKRGER
jgi:hypothetical protein